ncbi:hypothetical protein DSCA_37410 [Desulfosarcina alkanivorans]|jgi:crotonobetainyl-CoA:carnitine CoA-transferase CaiB-like acyl-CoA transferase|uniref:Uncharacterized protein n=1 Tax=Desulfosarcina alkanivorans TaxID=571177 RepID=A0A5K7YS51_9BACT|nr:CoA transferase [Desulfosarcina alkanivorans]BBO69811.1 hypothetical protein DSCA_37410 [Desulfosarcina alkanivorans]
MTTDGALKGVIYCSITGYGQTGNYRDRAGHDVNYASCTAGVIWTNLNPRKGER